MQEIKLRIRDLKLTLTIGQYAMKAYFEKSQKRNLTETVRAHEKYLPEYFAVSASFALEFSVAGKKPVV